VYVCVWVLCTSHTHSHTHTHTHIHTHTHTVCCFFWKTNIGTNNILICSNNDYTHHQHHHTHTHTHTTNTTTHTHTHTHTKVLLTGLLDKGINGVITALPKHCAPLLRLIFLVCHNTNAARVDILPSGTHTHTHTHTHAHAHTHTYTQRFIKCKMFLLFFVCVCWVCVSVYHAVFKITLLLKTF